MSTPTAKERHWRAFAFPLALGGWWEYSAHMDIQMTDKAAPEYATAEAVEAQLKARGYVQIEHAPKTPDLRAGARVHNAAERYARAYDEGTATVCSVWRRGTDERPSAWQQSYGRPDVEIVIQRDRADDPLPFYNWADYGTRVATVQPEAR